MENNFNENEEKIKKLLDLREYIFDKQQDFEDKYETNISKRFLAMIEFFIISEVYQNIIKILDIPIDIIPNIIKKFNNNYDKIYEYNDEDEKDKSILNECFEQIRKRYIND